MKPKTPSRAPATAVLAYWLLLVTGLAVLTVVRIGELDRMLPLWLGAVVGTAFGQVLAWRRMRLWLVGVVVLNSMWFGALMMMPFWAVLKDVADPWMAVEVSVLAFAPASLCGYLALTERGGLAAFWFPVVLWMLAILDRPGGAALADEGSWLMLSALAVLFLGFMHARETRRAALWRLHATVRLAPQRRREVLRETPLRVLAQVAWLAGLGAATLALTAWIAPHLWRTDALTSEVATPPQAAATAVNGVAGAGGPAGADASCCPEPAVVVAKREQVREYFPLLHTHSEEAPAPPPSDCVACVNGVPTTTIAGVGPGVGAGGATATDGHVAAAPTGTGSTQHYDGTGSSTPAATALPNATPAATTKPVPTAVAVAPTAPSATPPARRARGAVARVRRSGTATTGAPGAPVVVALVADEEEDHSLEWLATLTLVGVALHLALRPLRRAMTLRHLGRPLWPETVDQRVSNLWELMLVGLRDAGWRPLPGEQPQELARRVGLEGMKTCASVLERARHGVRVDAADLAAMAEAANAVYGTARGRIGRAARAASWLRWPLV